MRTKSPSSTTTSRARRHARRVPLSHPGEILLEEFLKPAGISQYALAKAISVPPRRINEIILGKRGISADTALRLAKRFGNSARFWMGLQADFDLHLAQREARQS